MIELRAVISDINKTREIVEKLGGKFVSNYELKDIIFIKNINDDLSKDFVRVRINIKSDWKTKKVILIRKQTDFLDIGKKDKVILKKSLILKFKH